MRHINRLAITLLSYCSYYFHAINAASYPNDPSTAIPSIFSGMSNHFTQYCAPFGIPIFAVSGFDQIKFKHACNVMAQFIDNDQDGCADDIDVVKSIRESKAGMGLMINESSTNFYTNDFHGQPLFLDETRPECSGSSETASCRDAALEEIIHVITHFGVSRVYNSDFGECYNGNGSNRSTLQVQMDLARGGHFTTVPSAYPSSAYYTYDDQTCDYECMAAEFIYWGITSILGGQEANRDDISNEWKLPTASEINSSLPQFYNLLRDNVTSMKLMSPIGVLPGSGRQSTGATATYNPSSQTCSNGCSLDGSGCGVLGGSNNVCTYSQTPTPPSPTPPSPTPPSPSLSPITPSPPTSLIPSPTPPTGDINGEEACENHGYSQSTCLSIGINNDCCQWDEGECWSAIGQNVCQTESAPPVPSPTSVSPDDSCQDVASRFSYGNKMKTCKFISWKTNVRCDKHGSAGSRNCPVTCKNGCKCFDTSDAFSLSNGKQRTCRWAANANTFKRCKKNVVRSNCPITCGVC